MFRRMLRPCACFGLALGLFLLALPLPGWGQDRTTDERLDRIERDLNMLQRQVYRGGPPPAAPSGDGEAVNTEIRMERLEEQMRELTGRVEELMNQVNQVRQRVEQVNSDVETRFSQAGGSAPPPAVAPPSPPPPPYATRRGYPRPPGDDDLTPPGGGARAETAADPDSPGPPGAQSGPTPIFGVLTPPGAQPPRQQRDQTASAAPPPSHGTLPEGSANSQYNYAFGLLKKADYPGAEAALKAFIQRHPKDALAGNAQYWLGETYYARHRYMEAASAFAEGYKRYPKSAKAPDELLKLGMALARANQKQNACVALGELDHGFPHAAASVRERAAAEKHRLGC